MRALSLATAPPTRAGSSARSPGRPRTVAVGTGGGARIGHGRGLAGLGGAGQLGEEAGDVGGRAGAATRTDASRIAASAPGSRRSRPISAASWRGRGA